MRKLRIKFLFIGGLLLAVAVVALQSFQPATALHSRENKLPVVVDAHESTEQVLNSDPIAQKVESSPVAGEKRVSIAELKKENEELTKIQDELITRFIKLRREHEALKKSSQTNNISNQQLESAEITRLTKERDQMRLNYETAQVQIEQLVQEKQGKLRLGDELSVVNSKAKLLQAEKDKLEAERSELQIQLSKAKSELESIRSGNRGVLQELESLRSQTNSEKNRFEKEEKRLKDEATQLSVNNQRLTQELGALRAEKSGLDAAIKSLREENSRSKSSSDDLAKQLTTQKEEIVSLNKKISTLQSELQAKEKLAQELGETKKQFGEKESETAKLSEKVTSLETELAAKSTKVASLEEQSKAKAAMAEQCDSQLSEARSKLVNITELERQLVQLQNELLLKNTELEIYSTNKQQSQPAVRSEPRVVRTPTQEIRAATSSQSALRNPEVVTSTSSPREMIVEITTSKGQLRSGPGKEHGVLMHVREGARLVVEDRQGEWFRVLTPTGTRAYVNQDIARIVGGESPSSNLSEHHVPGKQPARSFDGSPEEAAMQELKRGVSGR